MDEKAETLKTYNLGADKYIAKFRGLGPYKKDIHTAFSLIKKKNPKVVELGCGCGKEANEILKYTNNYFGIDGAKGMVEYAKNTVPEAKFVLADFEQYAFPKNVDIFFAFTSLLDLNKKGVKKVLDKAWQSLSNDGIFMISLKYGSYRSGSKKDEYGTKYFYYYTPDTIQKIAGKDYSTINIEPYSLLGEEWFKIILRKT